MIKSKLSILGCKAFDKVTKRSGVITSVSFDLYGCIQAVLTPQDDAKDKEERWFDVSRLELEGARVMDAPDYEYTHTPEGVARGDKGAASKPIP